MIARRQVCFIQSYYLSRMDYDTIAFRQPYKDINDTLYWMVEQAKAGVPYCREAFPKFSNPIDLYNYFNARVIYHNDPPGVELIQSPGTLFENNYWGDPGAGDCDCFVTLLLSCLWANGFNKNWIVLYGRSKKYPSHISLMTEFEGEKYYLDLTEKKFNKERHYPYYQQLKTF